MDDLPLYTYIMICGHSANAYKVVAGVNLPACVICGTTTVKGDQPDLTGRKARCNYWGKACPPTLRNQGYCPTRTKEDRRCLCEKDSSPSLWFFEYKPQSKYDQFYCSCWGDD